MRYTKFFPCSLFPVPCSVRVSPKPTLRERTASALAKAWPTALVPKTERFVPDRI
ncbi:MAG: hypothetical protein F6J94_29960 [Moorea sp. SIO1F2]|uniref:hypothetical protein n=1 Tax=Moorena sp. SIO1F2 TaxID=2607819 RepID=UPI0013BA9A90|nr:hypothetical protein [Moorena sp. SIO1F2]NET85961.1 hypothetical protein [Moorena sp. SIO1F2]